MAGCSVSPRRNEGREAESKKTKLQWMLVSLSVHCTLHAENLSEETYALPPAHRSGLERFALGLRLDVQILRVIADSPSSSEDGKRHAQDRSSIEAYGGGSVAISLMFKVIALDVIRGHSSLQMPVLGLSNGDVRGYIYLKSPDHHGRRYCKPSFDIQNRWSCTTVRPDMTSRRRRLDSFVS